MRIQWSGFEKLEAQIKKLSEADFKRVEKKSLTEMFNRAARANQPDGTPVGKSRKGYTGGQLRNSRYVDESSGSFGYTVEYAPHVEYGHRTRGGGFVPGQRFLQQNVENQRKIFFSDLKKVLGDAGK